eukprot:1825084-Amphidinium_carterae.1
MLGNKYNKTFYVVYGTYSTYSTSEQKRTACTFRRKQVQGYDETTGHKHKNDRTTKPTTWRNSRPLTTYKSMDMDSPDYDNVIKPVEEYHRNIYCQRAGPPQRIQGQV